MPIHDWTRVTPGIFHHFHQGWMVAISDRLNAGLLPGEYYALMEQSAGDGGLGVLAFAPRTETEHYVRKQTLVVIRHSEGDRVVALVEIMSPGSKISRAMLRSFVEKTTETLARGYHLSLVDLLPPTPRDPEGIHGAIWEEIADGGYQQPSGKPLTLVAYDAGPPISAYVQPSALGDVLPDLPLFLLSRHYAVIPLEPTYQTAFQHVPQRWRRVLENPG